MEEELVVVDVVEEMGDTMLVEDLVEDVVDENKMGEEGCEEVNACLSSLSVLGSSRTIVCIGINQIIGLG